MDRNFKRAAQLAIAPGRLAANGACVALCLLAFTLYTYRLDVKPLWWDEGFSIYVAQLPLGDLLSATAADVHPPVYYVLLNGWMAMAGASPFSTRFFSVLTGMLTIPLLYVTAQRLDGKRAGMLAATLSAVAPFVFYYDREIRMYSLGILLAMLATYAFLRILTDLQTARIWWLVYLLSISLGVSTQYVFALLPMAHAAALLLTYRQSSTILKRWLIAMLLAGVLLAPWLLYAGSQLRSLQAERVNPLPNLQVLGDMLPVFQQIVIGTASGNASAPIATLALTLLAFLGGATLFKRHHTAAVALALGALGAVLLIALVQYAPDEDLMRGIKLAFPGVPLWLLLTALGTSYVLRRWPWAGLAAVLLIITSTGHTIARSYHGPVDADEDYRPLIAEVQALAQPNDALLATYVWQDGYFASYAPHLPVVFYRNTYDPATVSELLGDIFDSHERLWVVNYFADVHDTGNPFNEWLNRYAVFVFDTWYGDSQLALFVRARELPLVWSAHAVYEDQVALDYVSPITSLQPGEVLSLDLRWHISAPHERAYKAFVHLGCPDTLPLAQSDADITLYLAPNDGDASVSVLQRHALLIPLDTLPGEYRLYVGVYNPVDNTRLNVLSPTGCDDLDRFCISTVEIMPCP